MDSRSVSARGLAVGLDCNRLRACLCTVVHDLELIKSGVLLHLLLHQMLHYAGIESFAVILLHHVLLLGVMKQTFRTLRPIEHPRPSPPTHLRRMFPLFRRSHVSFAELLTPSLRLRGGAIWLLYECPTVCVASGGGGHVCWHLHDGHLVYQQNTGKFRRILQTLEFSVQNLWVRLRSLLLEVHGVIIGGFLLI